MMYETPKMDTDYWDRWVRAEYEIMGWWLPYQPWAPDQPKEEVK